MIRFVRYAGEGMAGEYVEIACNECGELHCECSDQYRDPEALRRWMALPKDERDARLAAAQARIDEAFLTDRVEADLRFTVEMNKRRAA